MNNIIQGIPEWHAIRCGRVTASRVSDVMAKTKSGWGASRANYMAELIAERLTGEAAPSYSNAAMQWGSDQEPNARAAYEFRTDVTVELLGFAQHPTIKMAGASPDGLVGDEGLVEIKCPNTSTHIDTLLGGTVPSKYINQMQFQMVCTGRKWCDFVSYDPRLPESMCLFIARVNRDDVAIKEMESQIIEFMGEIDRKVEELNSRYDKPVNVLMAG